MPDENSTPVGTAQTSQDNQAVTNQTGDDFVLDFGEGENKEKLESSEAESHNLEGIEQEAEEEMVSTDIDLNDMNLFNEEEVKNEDNQENYIKIEDEKEDNGVAEDDFNISLDDNSSQENNVDENAVEHEFSLDSNEIIANESEETDNIENEGIKDAVKEKIEDEEVSNLGYQEEEKVDSNDSTIVEEENNLGNEENNADEVQDEGFLLDDENEDTSSDNEVKDDENTNIDDKELDFDEESSEIDNEDILNLDDSTENDDIAPTLPDESHEDEESILLDEGKDNEILESEDNEVLESEDNEVLESENDVDIESKEETENEDETKLSDDENDFSYDFQEDPTNDAENETEIEQKNDDMDLGDEKSELEENPVDINLDSTTNDENVAEQEEPLSQPEIGDLLGDAPVDFTEEVKDNAAEMQDAELNNESIDSQEGVDHAPENIDDNQVEKDSSINNDTENEEQSFTLDYQGEKVQDNPSNKEVNEISDETTETNEQMEEKSEEIPERHVNEMNQANLVNDIVTTSISNENSKEDVQNLEQKNTNSVQESADLVAGQQIKSTLSLDQILDSELTNNPQFEDSSKAVPTNVSSNGGASNKKIIGVIACVGLFVLAGVVAVLAFNNKGNTGEEVGIYETIEEYGTDPSHQAPAQPEEETTGKETTGQDTTTPHVGHTTIQQDFPEVETEEEGDTGTENPESEEPAPYTCEGNECFEEPVIVEEEDKKLDINSIEPVISSFKSQAEGYYSKGDELQDKKLIRYAAQAISLCESYQEQVNNGEGIDEESFESFNSKIKSIISKMENYLGGDTEIQTFTKSNFNEEYDFPGKEEHKEFIYEMANS